MTNSQAILESMNTALTRFRPLIPAGGVGSRLWPLSRAHAPKFLLDLTSSGNSLLRDTYDRLIDLSNGSVMVVTGTSHANAVTQQIPELRAADLVLEPSPTEPSSAFGYIHASESLGIEDAPNAQAVDTFVEKPDAATAQKYLDSGEYTWNAGMFVAPAALMLKHLEANEPELYAGIMEIANAWDTPEREAVMDRIWETLPKTAIDYAVAEPAAAAGDVAMVPGSFSWDDVGDFDAVARLNTEKSGEELTILGKKDNVMNHGCSGIIIANTDRKISIIGLDDIVVVDTPDALLVVPRSKAQAVKDAVGEVKARGLNTLL